MLTQGNEMSDGARRSIMDTAGFDLSLIVGPELENLYRAIDKGDLEEAKKIMGKQLQYRASFPSW
jgi:hypothetical protein